MFRELSRSRRRGLIKADDAARRARISNSTTKKSICAFGYEGCSLTAFFNTKEMALFPLLYRDNWGPSELARRFFNDDFGRVLLDGELFDPPFFHQRFYVEPYNRGRSDSTRAVAEQGSAVSCTPDKFAISVDTRHFAPEEITVKTQDNCIVIHGKHEEKSDDRGCYIMREFSRRYVLPEDVEPESVKCHLNPSGYLSLEAPRKNAPKKEDTNKPIPIEIKHESSAGGDKK
ncbi:alpha-crystallin A chain-like [Dermacentor andersoni]|uniref:alpha-crystallin A chain-like n=1 Tax=Dermacentor andersoni TaxID=34620 RepID=UPI002416485D|nr:alpha-crystallin A chain-like [Dermacentor andersoni]